MQENAFENTICQFFSILLRHGWPKSCWVINRMTWHVYIIIMCPTLLNIHSPWCKALSVVITIGQCGFFSNLQRTWTIISMVAVITLQWSHNERDGVSNHQPHDCSLKCLFRRRSKKISKFHVTGLCEGNSPVTGEFPAQRASNTENVSIWWCHHDVLI